MGKAKQHKGHGAPKPAPVALNSIIYGVSDLVQSLQASGAAFSLDITDVPIELHTQLSEEWHNLTRKDPGLFTFCKPVEQPSGRFYSLQLTNNSSFSITVHSEFVYDPKPQRHG